MKKILNLKTKLFWFLLAFIFISSCENQLDQETQQIDTLFPTLDSINFKIENNVLVFETYDDFYKMRDYLEETPNARSVEFESYIGFYSLRQEILLNDLDCKFDNQDMLALLNPEYTIIVGDYKFTYQLESETVEVSSLDSENLKNSGRIFDWHEDVEGIVFFNKTQSSKKSIMQTIWEDDYTWYASNNTTITAKIRYDHIPLFYEFFVKISKTAFRPGVEIYYEFGSNYLGSDYPTYWKRASGACNEDTGYSDDGTGSSLKYQIINKKLDACYGSAYFISWDNYQGAPIIHTQGAYIERYRNLITCD